MKKYKNVTFLTVATLTKERSMVEYQKLNPSFYLRLPFLQTAFASIKFRVSGELLRKHSKFQLITTRNQAKLLGSYAEQAHAKGLIVLLHGWEGGIESTYMLRTGQYMFRNGYNVYRLNLRDHGNTHHLNEMPFNGTLIDETYDAMVQISKLAGNLPVYLVGFSLGGNFVLRIAMKHSKSPKREKINRLQHVLGISPAVDPRRATERIDADFLLGPHFLNQWSNSLRKKAELFPYLFDFNFLWSARSVLELTELAIQSFLPFKDANEYFQKYTVTGSFFKGLKVPTTIYSSADDPIITEDDFNRIDDNSLLRIIMTDRGGHNGFLINGFWPAYLDLLDQIIKDNVVSKQ